MRYDRVTTVWRLALRHPAGRRLRDLGATGVVLTAAVSATFFTAPLTDTMLCGTAGDIIAELRSRGERIRAPGNRPMT